MPLGISRRAAYGLHERGLRAKEPLLVGVQNCDQRNLRNIEPLAEQVDADQHIELVETHRADNLCALQGVDVRVQVADADADFAEISRQILRHALGERRDQNLILLLNLFVDLAEQVVNLALNRAHRDLRIQEAGRAYQLLRAEQFMLRLVAVRRRRDKEHLIHALLEFREVQRAVVHGTRQAEAVLYERRLSRKVAVEHAADLRNRDMALVDNREKVLREIVNQRKRRLARLLFGQKARVVLNAGAKTGLP